jgi:hypothetical protein
LLGKNFEDRREFRGSQCARTNSKRVTWCAKNCAQKRASKIWMEMEDSMEKL